MAHDESVTEPDESTITAYLQAEGVPSGCVLCNEARSFARVAIVAQSAIHDAVEQEPIGTSGTDADTYEAALLRTAQKYIDLQARSAQVMQALVKRELERIKQKCCGQQVGATGLTMCGIYPRQSLRDQE